MTCVSIPTKRYARSEQARGTRPPPPDQTDCRPNCRNKAYTDRDIAALRHEVAELQTAQRTSLAPSPRHQRLNATLERLQRSSTPTRATNLNRQQETAVNRTATASWPTEETDPQRVGILAAADRMLSGKPQRCSGNLSVSQLAVEANVKYWVVAQRQYRPSRPLPSASSSGSARRPRA